MLFGKLQQGVQENQQILTVARLRADAEDQYGNSLAGITPATERISGGFNKDEGASVRKVRKDGGTHWYELQLTTARPTRVCAPKWRPLRRTTRRLPRTSANSL